MIFNSNKPYIHTYIPNYLPYTSDIFKIYTFILCKIYTVFGFKICLFADSNHFSSLGHSGAGDTLLNIIID